MSTREDGGSAFPNTYLDARQGSQIVDTGMSLRDYFAAKAMQGLLVNEKSSDWRSLSSNIAKIAYVVADAMLNTRDVKN